jgi:hypothetical protein
MKKEELSILFDDALNDSELKSENIPVIDLYVDQIISLVSDKLSEGSERYRDRTLTKTMINNYSKDGLITPVKGKKYSKEQILQILSIYTLKNTLSIGEIKRVLNGISEIEGDDVLTDIYDKHVDIKARNRDVAKEIFNGIVARESFDLDSDADYGSALGALVSLSAQLKNMALSMIDAKFPEPSDEEKDKEKDKEKG